MTIAAELRAVAKNVQYGPLACQLYNIANRLEAEKLNMHFPSDKDYAHVTLPNGEKWATAGPVARYIQTLLKAEQQQEWPKEGDSFFIIYPDGEVGMLTYSKDHARALSRGLLFRTEAEALADDRKRQMAGRMFKLLEEWKRKGVIAETWTERDAILAELKETK